VTSIKFESMMITRWIQ